MAMLDSTTLQFHYMKAWALMMLTSHIKLKNSLKFYGLKEILLFDKSNITILYQNQVNGLQILTKDGQWINVDPTPDTFIVLIGDSLHAWTNGRIHAPFHRVMMKGNEARYSIGLFTIPKAGYMIKAPKELVDEEHPLLYMPFSHLEFITFSYTEEGMKCESALKTYCGV